MNAQSFVRQALALAAALCLATPSSGMQEAQPRRPMGRMLESQALSDRLIVKYHRSGDAVLDARSEMGVRITGNRQGLSLLPVKRLAGGAQVFHVGRSMTHGELRQAAARLADDNPEIEYAEPDRLLHTQALPNDSLLSQQWHLGDPVGGLRATGAWSQSTGAGVVVAVIDTGVRPHADLQANLLTGYDFISDIGMAGDGNGRDADAYDPGDFVSAGLCGVGSRAGKSSWHGTHVVGIVAAVGGNGFGVAGVAYGARVLPLRVQGKCGGYTSDIASAISWAAGEAVAGAPVNANPARVINLSLGGDGGCDRTMQSAIDVARARGAVVVVAAGNSAVDVAGSTPANCAGVVAVAATNKAGGRASYSNSGAAITVAAPGGDNDAAILSTLNTGSTAPVGDSYASYMGTSMATPAVSGVVALMIAANRNLTPDQVSAILRSTARAFPQACSGCGAGIVDAAAAVARASGAGTGTGAATPTPPPVEPPVAPVVTPTAVAERESNDTLAKAQVLPAFPLRVSGGLASTKDTDYFKVSLPAGATVTSTLSMGSKSAFGLYVYNSAGKLLASSTGTAGVSRQLAVRNAGAAALPLVLRVVRNSGVAGSYQVELKP